jgi:hypothetical protein
MCFGDIEKFISKLPLYDINSLSYNRIGNLFVWYYLFHLYNQNIIKKIYYIILFLLGRSKSKINIIKKIAKMELDEIIDYTSLDECYKYLSKEFLMLKKEPSHVYQNIKNRGKVDIEELEKRIADYKMKQAKLLDDNSKKKDEINYERYLLQHFINRNKEALAEIKVFFELKVKGWCISKSINDFGMELFEIPYNYAWWPSRFTIQEEYKFFNKFQELPFHEFKRIVAEYKIDKNSIYINADVFIEEHKIINKCKSLLSYNHILYQRKSVIEKIISFYNVDNFTFCNLIYPQIEGLFYEYCKYIGYTDDSLFSSSISDKAKFLFENKLITQYDFEYYAYLFPIARNRLAHGIEYELEFSEMAKMLLLDFFHTLNISLSNKFDFNYIIKTIENVEREKSFEYINNYCLIIGKKLNNYYELDKRTDKIKNEVDWISHLEELSDKCLNWDICAIAKIISINLKQKSIMQNKCIEILRKIGNKKIADINIEEYLQQFIRSR